MANKGRHDSENGDGSLQRRTFLTGVGLTGVGALAMTAVQPTQAQAKEAATGKYRVAVIGHTGRGGYGHGLDSVWLDMPRTEIVGVADPDSDGLTKAVRRLAAPKGYPDYRQMLDELKPDLVSIGTQNIDVHRDMVVAAAERGVRGIYIEKPLCRTLEEADEMVAVCRQHNVKLATAHQSRYVPKMKVIQEIIRSGKLGDVLEIRSRCKEDARGGGLGLWVLGTRVLMVMQALAGDPVSCFATVLQDRRPITRQDVRDSQANGIGPLAGDEVHAMYRFSSGTTGYFDSLRRAGAPNPWRFGVRIFGTEGVLHWSSTELLLGPAHFLPDPLWDAALSGKRRIPVSSAGIGVAEPIRDAGHGHHAGNVLAANDLIAAIEADRQPLSNLEDARTNLEMIVAVFESHRVGGPVSFPMKTRKNPLTLLE